MEEGPGIVQRASENELGYFYRFQNGKVRLIKYLLDENGFRDVMMR